MNKKIVSLFAITALLLTVSCKKNEPIAPPPAPTEVAVPTPEAQLNQPPAPDANIEETDVAFTQEVYDFGTINQGDKVHHSFTFKNTGENDLIISRAMGSCGCTVPEFPKEPIAPGKTGSMKVTFNSAGKSGKQEKSVTVYANVPNGVKVIKIKANIKVS